MKHATRFASQANKNLSLLDHNWINFINCDCQFRSVIYDTNGHFPRFLSINTSTTVSSINEKFTEVCVDNFRSELSFHKWNFSDFQCTIGKFEYLLDKIQGFFEYGFQIKSWCTKLSGGQRKCIFLLLQQLHECYDANMERN